jgi:tRNA-specific 2-thiouridylase
MIQKKKIVIGLSGGLDSFATAFLLKQEGHELIAVSFNLYNNQKSIEKARFYAAQLSIPFYEKEISSVFKNKIINPFVDAYLSGKTPNPCTWCNKEIKAAYLYQFMKEQKADFFATGHYVSIKYYNDKYFIFRGKDLVKDQSYFLWNTNQKYLSFWKTPLGDYKKEEIRQKAIDWGYPELAIKKESMGVCFLKEKGYANFILQHKNIDKDTLKGNIFDENGAFLGEHKGIAFYTIGQKKGLPFYDKNKVVSKIDAQNKTIYITNESSLYVSSFNVVDYYFADDRDIKSTRLQVWVRGIGRNPKGFCKIIKGNKNIRVDLEGKAYAIASGQPVAFYISDRLVGGGFVC